ncbi:MAG: hypothetical protein ACRDLU_01205 [Gaiellaceae bacterium]
MFAFGLALGVIAGIAGSDLESVRVSQPELFMLGMGSAMSVTMVAWMRHRRHKRQQAWEMTVQCSSPCSACSPATGRVPSRPSRSARSRAY